MKTIKERAKKASPYFADQEWYIQGAKDQRKIDIEKACEWLKNNYWTCSSIDEYVDDFCKAMEE